jgi:carbon storage regulator CsrA
MGGQSFELIVSSVRGNTVSLAFKAPKEIRVFRKELKERTTDGNPAREKKVG